VSGPLGEEMAVVTSLWAQLRVPDRARYLERAAQAVIDEFDDLCLALARESQRPRAEIAALELLAAVDALRWLAENSRRLTGARRFGLPRSLHPLTRASAGFAPVGVVGIRGVRGAPFAEPLATVGAALLAGNGVVLAPGPDAVAAGGRLAGVLARAGLPEGLVRVGNVSLARCARVLEEGAGPRGADAMIVLADANLRHAAEGALWGACCGAGQLAGSVKRLYVAQERSEELLEALCTAARELTLGDPLLPATQLGPLAGEPVADALADAIDEATSAGAVLHCGGRTAVAGAAGTFFAPAILSGVPADARLVQARVPGPVLSVTAVADSAAAVALANGGERSLGASVWGSDRRAAVRIARELQARVVWGNDHPPSPPPRMLAAQALSRCTREQLIAWDPPSRRPPWRYPYDAAAANAAHTLATLHSAREGDRERALREGGSSAAVWLAGRTLRG
jgi:acyl-CoA reductase-like NAD-dependent aldehyde dehydrogenase